MSHAGLVSVVLPCFNVEQFVSEALESLLGQTYRDLEILAIDDGSKDSTPAILKRYAQDDSRIRAVRNKGNLGLIPTLNRGVAASRGVFIARMDADDVAAPSRLARQVQVLESHPDIDVVGAAIDLLDERGRPTSRIAPVRCRGPAGARFLALFATPIAHMTLMARSEILREHLYGSGSDSLHTEDYELFTRMLAAGARFMNLDEPLVAVRATPSGVSRRHERVQIENFVSCSRRHLERSTGMRPAPAAHRALVNRIDGTVGAADLRAGLRCLGELERIFVAKEPGEAAEIRGIADEQRVDIISQALLRGGRSARWAAVPLAARYATRLLSRRALRYLGAKARAWMRKPALAGQRGRRHSRLW